MQFFKSLSTYLGCTVTNTTDIHTLKRYKKIYKQNETKHKQRNIKIIAEIHPQHMGSIEEVQRIYSNVKLVELNYIKFVI